LLNKVYELSEPADASSFFHCDILTNSQIRLRLCLRLCLRSDLGKSKSSQAPRETAVIHAKLRLGEFRGSPQTNADVGAEFVWRNGKIRALVHLVSVSTTVGDIWQNKTRRSSILVTAALNHLAAPSHGKTGNFPPPPSSHRGGSGRLLLGFLCIIYYQSYTQCMTDRRTVRTIKTVRESTRPKHKHWI